MNPLKQIETEITLPCTDLVPVECTDWFSYFRKEPGQPGVFEVNGKPVFDNEDCPRRFSFFNGKAFGPIKPTPDDAYDARFEVSLFGDTIHLFRGLVEAV